VCVCTTGFLNAGSGTETVLYEAAAYGLVGVVSGGDLWETAVAHNKYCNYATPLEARLACEVGHTAARQGMTRAQANEIALELLEKLGVSEDQCARVPTLPAQSISAYPPPSWGATIVRRRTREA
jgi:methylamine--corrinoid protein Co-methyltransferase